MIVKICCAIFIYTCFLSIITNCIDVVCVHSIITSFSPTLITAHLLKMFYVTLVSTCSSADSTTSILVLADKLLIIYHKAHIFHYYYTKKINISLHKMQMLVKKSFKINNSKLTISDEQEQNALPIHPLPACVASPLSDAVRTWSQTQGCDDRC